MRGQRCEKMRDDKEQGGGRLRWRSFEGMNGIWLNVITVVYDRLWTSLDFLRTSLKCSVSLKCTVSVINLLYNGVVYVTLKCHLNWTILTTIHLYYINVLSQVIMQFLPCLVLLVYIGILVGIWYGKLSCESVIPGQRHRLSPDMTLSAW